VRRARLRLGSLWVSQTARVLADWCLRLVAFLAAAGPGRQQIGSAWHLATAVFIAPFILLAPVNGTLCNDLSRRRVLVASAAIVLAVVAGFALTGGPWIVCLGLTALAVAVYSPARYAMLPAAARDAHLPLPRINSWFEMATASAILGGVALGWWLVGPGWEGSSPLPAAAIWALLGLNALCLLTAFPTQFPSDQPRREPAGRAVTGFFRDIGRVFRDRPSAAPLLGLASFQAVVTAGSGALIAQSLDEDLGEGEQLLNAVLLLGVGAALGCLVAGFNAHPRRNLGYVTLGSTGLLGALGLAALSAGSGDSLPVFPCLLLGFTGGLVNAPLRAAYLAAVPADARGNATAVMNTAIYVLVTALAVLMFGLTSGQVLPTPTAQLLFLAVLAALGAVLAWRVLFVHTLELGLEWLLSPLYRIRAVGPGAERIPVRGPLLVVANHASWLDPLWLGKVVPRHMTPMMTRIFYDLPVLRFLMVRLVGAIRVEEGRFRREAPELREAVEVLRRGDCLLLFPEGKLRRKEEPILGPFGRGVWHILQEAPQTPVMVCWIEGGWGSYLSWKDGPPMQNKRFDWARPIRIAFAEPHVLPPEVLADHRATRDHLAQECLECRQYLGG
jgi:acyl-[acyl-carrier-protein]-phospholipid O-acyltransferase/long-chain-fatty-acid--[acyl-carrier-protein] ligase